MVLHNDASKHYSFVPIARKRPEERRTYYSNFDIEFYDQHLITGMIAIIRIIKKGVRRYALL